MTDLVWVQWIHSNPLHAPPAFLNRPPIKCNNLVSMGPNYFFLMGNLKLMTRAYMPRHARACMFLTLSLYMLMHVSIKSVSICLLVCCLYMYMYVSVCLCMNIQVPDCACVCARVCVCVGRRHFCSYRGIQNSIKFFFLSPTFSKKSGGT